MILFTVEYQNQIYNPSNCSSYIQETDEQVKKTHGQFFLRSKNRSLIIKTFTTSFEGADNSLPLISVMSHPSPVHIDVPYFSKMDFRWASQSTSRHSKWPLTFRFQIIIFYAHFVSPVEATCLAPTSSPHQYLAKSTNGEASVSCHFLAPTLDLSCYKPTTVLPCENWLWLDVRLVSLFYACSPPSLREGLRLKVRPVSVSKHPFSQKRSGGVIKSP